MSIPTVGPHVVRRPFDADGRRMIPGEIVDVTEWRNAYQLVDRGYLIPAPNETIASAKPPAKKAAVKKAPAKRSTSKN